MTLHNGCRSQYSALATYCRLYHYWADTALCRQTLHHSVSSFHFTPNISHRARCHFAFTISNCLEEMNKNRMNRMTRTRREREREGEHWLSFARSHRHDLQQLNFSKVPHECVLNTPDSWIRQYARQQNRHNHYCGLFFSFIFLLYAAIQVQTILLSPLHDNKNLYVPQKSVRCQRVCMHFATGWSSVRQRDQTEIYGHGFGTNLSSQASLQWYM